MRLYAICKTDKRPFYIASHVRVRSKLPSSFFLTCPYGHTSPLYSTRYFCGDNRSNTVIGGALPGGLIGLLVGGAGAVLGLLTGGLLWKERNAR